MQPDRPSDLTTASVAELEAFIFDHPAAVRSDDETSPEWFWTEAFTAEVEPARQLKLMASLFANSATLRQRYSAAQLEQGLWLIFGPAGSEAFAGLLADDQVSMEIRIQFVEHIFFLYDELLSHVQLDTATFMLWDLLLEHFFRADARALVVPEPLQATMFATLVRILSLADHESQRAALHGLGHLRHAGTSTVVAAYLRANPRIPPELREYARRVLMGAAIQ